MKMLNKVKTLLIDNGADTAAHFLPQGDNDPAQLSPKTIYKKINGMKPQCCRFCI